MPTSLASRLQEGVLALAWSLWAELGVSGWSRRPGDRAIDPEALVLFTAGLGDADPRLRDESTDWCIRYHRYVSVARLRNLLRSEWADVASAFGEYAATVNARSSAGWPGATRPRAFEPTGRSALEDFVRPALLRLRLRALFGVTARADLIGALVEHPDRAFSTADLAEAVSFTKRNVGNELESLRMAGVVTAVSVRNERRFRLARREEMLELAAPLPACFPRWSPLLRVLFETLGFARRAEELDPVVRAVEAKRTLRSLEPALRQASLPPPKDVPGTAFYEAFGTWAIDLVDRLARGDAAACDGARRALRR